MLNTIKDLIKQKTAFQEAADLILEDESIDDMIILHEESDDLSGSDEVTEEEEKDAPEEGEEPAKNGDDDTAKDDDDIMDEPIDDEDDKDTSSKPDNNGDILDEPIEDDLPTPIGAQTGEPAEIGDGDLLSMEIDIVSNTPKDLLPIPPAGASDVVPGAMRTRVDSGFSTADVAEEEDSRDPQAEEEAADILDLPMDEAGPSPSKEFIKRIKDQGIKDGHLLKFDDLDKFPDDLPNEDDDKKKEVSESYDLLDESMDDYEESTDILDLPMDDLLYEAITIGGDDGSNGDTNAEAPADASNEPAPDQPADNVVTAAVKDKVGEMDASGPEPDTNTNANNTSKEAILKKLTNLTKTIEDTKNLVIDSQS